MVQKLIIVEGPRNTGKTHLTQSLDQNLHPRYKFNFSDLFETIEDDPMKILGMSFGKDIQLLNLNRNRLLGQSLVVDRCFFSSAVFGVIFDRMTFDESVDYLEWVQKTYFMEENSPEMVYIYGRNPVERKVKDKWSGKIDYDVQHDLYRRYFEHPRLENLAKKVWPFLNQFNDGSISNFKRYVESI